jgi:putative ABC transport system permease protein
VLNDRTLAEFRDLPGVVAVTPREGLMGSGMLRLNRLMGNAQVVGLDPTEAGRLKFPLESGTDRLGRWQALAGARVAEGFYDPQAQRPVKEPPDLQGQGLQLILSKTGDDGRPVERAVRLRVAGVLEESGGQDDYTLYLALNDVLELNAWLTGQRANPGREGYNQALVKVATPEQVLAVEREIVGQGFYAYSARSTLQEVNTIFLVIQGVFGGIGAIALIVAAFGIANTMTMAIYERTREIGLMKAVGATNRDVMSIFLAEAGSIGLLGGIGGVLLGVGLGMLIDLIAGTYLAALAVQQGGAAASEVSISLIHTPLWLPLFAAVFAALVGVASGTYPAMRAAALSPVAALKYE